MEQSASSGALRFYASKIHFHYNYFLMYNHVNSSRRVAEYADPVHVRQSKSDGFLRKGGKPADRYDTTSY
jgi:hypothetical protein